MNSESHGSKGPIAKRAGSTLEIKNFELSARRTGLSFQRTRLSADRTLMSVLRTSFAMIGFGFTIFQVYRSFRETPAGSQLIPVNLGRNFGITLVALGEIMLALGIWYHVRFMRELRDERRKLIERSLVDRELSFPISMTLIMAILLLLLGLLSIFNIVTRIGPFQ